jgi:hypothetical protein
VLIFESSQLKLKATRPRDSVSCSERTPLMVLIRMYRSYVCAWIRASAATWRSSALFSDVTQRRVVIPYRRLGTNYRSERTSWPLNMGPICCPETSVRNYHSTLRNIPEECRSLELCVWNVHFVWRPLRWCSEGVSLICDWEPWICPAILTLCPLMTYIRAVTHR